MGDSGLEDAPSGRDTDMSTGLDKAKVDAFSPTQKVDGKPGSDPEKTGLMHSVLEGDKKAIDLGNLALDAMNNGG